LRFTPEINLRARAKISNIDLSTTGFWGWEPFLGGVRTSFIAAGQISKPRFFIKKTGWLNLIENAARYQLLPSERLNS
jgi:hypothetical protein